MGLMDAAIGYQARKTREAVEEQNRLLREQAAQKANGDPERDAQWRAYADTRWQDGWTAGWKAAMEQMGSHGAQGR